MSYVNYRDDELLRRLEHMRPEMLINAAYNMCSGTDHISAEDVRTIYKLIDKEIDRRKQMNCGETADKGSISDGYHTFNELYHHRAVLFSVIVRDHPEIAWKSKVHHDGTMFDGMFIVGIETPEGQATYHYDIDPYWDMFDCKDLERAPEWDGHTPDEAIERIATLGWGTCRYEWSLADNGWADHTCSACGYVENTDVHVGLDWNYCPNCGRRIEVDE